MVSLWKQPKNYVSDSYTSGKWGGEIHINVYRGGKDKILL